MAIILVGIAIASLVAASRTFTRITGTAAEVSTAEFLAEQIRELMVLLPVIDPQTGTGTFGPEPDEATLADYDDLDDFDDAALSPPISADRAVLSNHASSFVRVTVKVLLKSDQITSASWIRAKY